MGNNLESDWNKILYKISEEFDVDADLSGTLLLIGIQERGNGFKEKYSKDEKSELIGLAECTLLKKWGYYSVQGFDEENWPIFKQEKKHAPFGNDIMQQLLKSSIVEYFAEIGYIN